MSYQYALNRMIEEDLKTTTNNKQLKTIGVDLIQVF
jgi:hypothetical protein